MVTSKLAALLLKPLLACSAIICCRSWGGVQSVKLATRWASYAIDQRQTSLPYKYIEQDSVDSAGILACMTSNQA